MFPTTIGMGLYFVNTAFSVLSRALTLAKCAVFPNCPNAITFVEVVVVAMFMQMIIEMVMSVVMMVVLVVMLMLPPTMKG